MKNPIITAVLAFTATAGLAMTIDSRIDDPVAAAIAHKDRPAGDLDRDDTRHPAQILDFFDIKRGMHVADFFAGNGYYTELLAKTVGENGKVYTQNTHDLIERFLAAPLDARFKDGRLPNAVRLDEDPDELSVPMGLDAAILVRFYHDFGHLGIDRKAFNAKVFKLLKPGGVYGVVDHHAKPGTGISGGKSLHRVEESMVIEELEAAGFVLEAVSYVLNDDGDTLDWNIFEPDTVGRDATSRFVHLYRKPFDAKESK